MSNAPIRCACGRPGWQFKAGQWWCWDHAPAVVVMVVKL